MGNDFPNRLSPGSRDPMEGPASWLSESRLGAQFSVNNFSIILVLLLEVFNPTSLLFPKRQD